MLSISRCLTHISGPSNTCVRWFHSYYWWKVILRDRSNWVRSAGVPLQGLLGFQARWPHCLVRVLARAGMFPSSSDACVSCLSSWVQGVQALLFALVSCSCRFGEDNSVGLNHRDSATYVGDLDDVSSSWRQPEQLWESRSEPARWQQRFLSQIQSKMRRALKNNI